MNKAEFQIFQDEMGKNFNQMIYDPNAGFMMSAIQSDSKYMMTGSNMALFNVNEGFEKGNLFKNLYEPYKNYQPKNLQPKNEEEEILLSIDELAFALHEIDLYLCVYPDDVEMINLYNQLQREYDQILKYYESKFGPIQTNNPYMTRSPFAWTEDTWPWDRRYF